MIAEVIYNHPLNIGAIVACVIGLLIGIGFLSGTFVLKHTHKIKPIHFVVFLLISIAIIVVGIYSLVKALS